MFEIVVPIIAGLFVGVLVGLTGMGGGALTTPFLMIVMKLDPVLAVGTDLVFAFITKISGGIEHFREKNVEMKQVLYLALGSLPATVIGARIILSNQENKALIENIMPRVLGATLVLVGLLILGRVTRLLGPKEHIEVRMPPPWALILVGAIGGFLVGMTSIGGGTVIMALLLIFFSIPLNLMVGLDVMHGALLAFVAATTYAFGGQVQWGLVGYMLIGSIPGAWLGARLVNRIDRRLIRGGLGVMIIGAGLHMLINQFGGH